MVKLLQRFAAIVIGSWMISLQLLAADILVTTDRNPVSLNQSFRLTYEAIGAVDGDPDFSPLEEQLEILSRSHSNSINFINGGYSRKMSWTFTAMAKRAGELTLPTIVFGRDQSPSYRLTVEPASPQDVAKGGLFTELKVDQQQVYVQQQLVLTQQLYSAGQLSAYQMQPPEISGVDVIVMALGDERQYSTERANQSYTVVEKSYAVFPQQTGTLQIAPALAEVRIGYSSSSVFGPFTQRGQSLMARSNELQLEVLPVPADADMTPWLPARALQISEQWPQQPPQLVQGEPITRTLSIKAEGLTAAQLPELARSEIVGLKQYPDQPLLNDVDNDSGMTGYRVEKIAYIPTRAGRVQLPAVELAWWNTQTQQREVARIPARSIDVVASPVPQLSRPQAPLVAAPQAQAPSSAPDSSAPQPVQGDPINDGWKLLAILLGSGWLLTILLWTLNSRRGKTTPVQASPIRPPSKKQYYRPLAKACDDRDPNACRAALLAWARIIFAPAQIRVLNDLQTRVPADMAAQIQRIDAVLYGGQQQPIDFDLIKQQARQLMKQRPQPEQQLKPLLEPLYK